MRNPPRNITPAARKIWKAIAASLPDGHLNDSDIPLFSSYCESLADLENGRAQWREEGSNWTVIHPNGTTGADPMLAAIQRQAGVVATLATKLRLCPSSRITAQTAGRGTHRNARKGRFEDLL